MESSDDSFVWSNASSASSENDIMPSKYHHSGNDTKDRNVHTEDCKNDVHEVNGEKKNKKRKHEENIEDNIDHLSVKRKRIKLETNSDNDNKTDQLASYLKDRVKEESLSSSHCEVSSSKKRVKDTSEKGRLQSEITNILDIENDNIKAIKKKKKNRDTYVKDESTETFETSEYLSLSEKLKLKVKKENSAVTESEAVKPKKKKSKHEYEELVKESDCLNNSKNCDEVRDVSVLQNGERKKNKKKKSRRPSESEGINGVIENETTEHSNKLHNNSGVSFVSSTMLENESHLNKSNINNDISIIPIKISNKNSRISDRIRFEDDDNSSGVEDECETHDILSSVEAQSFLKSNPHLTPLKSFVPFNTKDDDTWVLKCPSDISIDDFKSANLVIDSKSKLKIGGQLFDGYTNDEECKVPIIAFSKNKSYLKYMSVKQTITFHKRIPKTHIQDDSVQSNNLTNFISLPDTKCRHPIFGADYKKAIKVNKYIRERISESGSPAVAHVPKKKKHKKEKNKVECDSEVENNVTLKVKGEPESPKRKKKRKHKHIEDVKPVKRIKLEQDPNAWESEKAIEENLFNF